MREYDFEHISFPFTSTDVNNDQQPEFEIFIIQTSSEYKIVNIKKQAYGLYSSNIDTKVQRKLCVLEVLQKSGRVSLKIKNSK